MQSYLLTLLLYSKQKYNCKIKKLYKFKKIQSPSVESNVSLTFHKTASRQVTIN